MHPRAAAIQQVGWVVRWMHARGYLSSRVLPLAPLEINSVLSSVPLGKLCQPPERKIRFSSIVNNFRLANGGGRARIVNVASAMLGVRTNHVIMQILRRALFAVDECRFN